MKKYLLSLVFLLAMGTMSADQQPFMRPNPNGLTDYITYSAPFSSIYINSLN